MNHDPAMGLLTDTISSKFIPPEKTNLGRSPNATIIPLIHNIC